MERKFIIHSFDPTEWILEQCGNKNPLSKRAKINLRNCCYSTFMNRFRIILVAYLFRTWRELKWMIHP